MSKNILFIFISIVIAVLLPFLAYGMNLSYAWEGNVILYDVAALTTLFICLITAGAFMGYGVQDLKSRSFTFLIGVGFLYAAPSNHFRGTSLWENLWDGTLEKIIFTIVAAYLTSLVIAVLRRKASTPETQKGLLVGLWVGAITLITGFLLLGDNLVMLKWAQWALLLTVGIIPGVYVTFMIPGCFMNWNGTPHYCTNIVEPLGIAIAIFVNVIIYALLGIFIAWLVKRYHK